MDNTQLRSKIEELRNEPNRTDQQNEELTSLEVSAKVLGLDIPQRAEEVTEEPTQEAVEPVETETVEEEAVADAPSQEEGETQEEETVGDDVAKGEQSHTDMVKTDRKILWTMMEQLETLKTLHPEAGRELSMGYTKLQESRHWLGEVLGKLGIELPSEYTDTA